MQVQRPDDAEQEGASRSTTATGDPLPLLPSYDAMRIDGGHPPPPLTPGRHRSRQQAPPPPPPLLRKARGVAGGDMPLTAAAPPSHDALRLQQWGTTPAPPPHPPSLVPSLHRSPTALPRRVIEATRCALACGVNTSPHDPTTAPPSPPHPTALPRHPLQAILRRRNAGGQHPSLPAMFPSAARNATAAAGAAVVVTGSGQLDSATGGDDPCW